MFRGQPREVKTVPQEIEFKKEDTSNFEPLWAKEELVSTLHSRVNNEKTSDPKELFFKCMMDGVKNNRNVKLAIDLCVHCGACLNACPTYLSTEDIHNSPVGRADLIRGLLKSRNLSGKLLGKAVGAIELNDQSFRDISTYYYQCLECRRCGEICPFGIDQADVTRTIRSALYDTGKISRYTAIIIDNAERTGNNMALPPPALRSTIEFAQDEIKEEKGVDVAPKIDEPAYAMFVPPSADFFSNMETLKGYMLFLHSIGLDYTFATEHAELANFGLFTDEKHLRAIGNHMVEVATKLGAKIVVVGECGHGWRAFKNYVIPELSKRGITGMHVFNLVQDAIKDGKIKFEPKKNDGPSYVYQDPCNYARGGDMIDEPRFILSNVVSKYQDSPHSRERTWCCGGGGGLLSDEFLPLRTEYAKLWYEDTLSIGGDYVIRPCAICKAQLSHTLPRLNKKYDHKVSSSGLMDLVYNAIIP